MPDPRFALVGEDTVVIRSLALSDDLARVVYVKGPFTGLEDTVDITLLRPIEIPGGTP